MGYLEEISRQWEILLVEDNLADIRLTREACKELQLERGLEVAQDGVAAVAYLSGVLSGQVGSRPDIILLHLNLPRPNGFEVLAAIKASKEIDQFFNVMQSVRDFWLGTALLPEVPPRKMH